MPPIISSPLSLLGRQFGSWMDWRPIQSVLVLQSLAKVVNEVANYLDI